MNGIQIKAFGLTRREANGPSSGERGCKSGQVGLQIFGLYPNNFAVLGDNHIKISGLFVFQKSFVIDFYTL